MPHAGDRIARVGGVPATSRVAHLSRSAGETVELGRALGGLLAPGDVVVLTGDLGAGKTQLVKGIAAALGVAADVTSPTFTIEAVYEGASFPLHHFDLYRLERADQLEDTGLFDVLGGDGACVIEWGEQFEGELGDERLGVTIAREGASPAVEPPRLVTLAGEGPRGRALAAAADAAMARALP